MTYAAATAVWMCDSELYSANEVFLSALVKLSHLVSFGTILYMFSTTKRKKRKNVMLASVTTTQLGSTTTDEVLRLF